eukprot:scaffold6323_cov118-Skeletonema_dohrnii-CCMP3373.AAC.2
MDITKMNMLDWIRWICLYRFGKEQECVCSVCHQAVLSLGQTTCLLRGKMCRKAHKRRQAHKSNRIHGRILNCVVVELNRRERGSHAYIKFKMQARYAFFLSCLPCLAIFSSWQHIHLQSGKICQALPWPTWHELTNAVITLHLRRHDGDGVELE